ncbi:MAG: acyltransferase [Candidatus Abyssobacteria bacterium SURF_5]|uniref:Acyltransferase n=1 Tax=Abyssobacteria bacterium (strain SURF_5) TaxID=2093360 RepID=A0A3A4NVZ7_ABYX5|nr:MAG: acyltransferase [Candidatus Abyssubacteria bacterium SURF_5]
MDAHNSQRRHDIDWLRILAVLLLFFFHTARIFDTDDFYVKNTAVSEGFTVFINFIYLWHMPLFFFLSGVGTWFALRSRGGRGYASERFKRLFIPLLFGACFIVPPQVYYMRLSGQTYNHPPLDVFEDSYLQFFPTFFNGIAPSGNWEWGHLWFLAYLFTFSLVALPLFRSIEKTYGRGLVEKLASVAEKRGGIFLFGLPLMAGEALLRANWPGMQNLYNDWSNFLFFILFFIYGYLLCSDERFWQAVERDGKLALLLAAAIFSIYPLRLALGHLPSRGYNPDYMSLMALRGLDAWLWVVAVLSFGRRYLGFTNRILTYANEAALPVYILHQTVIVMVGYYVVRWQTGMMSGYFIITMLSLVVTLLACDLLVRRINVVRFLFGMRAKRSRAHILAFDKARPENP